MDKRIRPARNLRRVSKGSILVSQQDYEATINKIKATEEHAKTMMQITFSFVLGLHRVEGQVITDSLLHQVMTDAGYEIIYTNPAIGKQVTIGHGKEKIHIR